VKSGLVTSSPVLEKNKKWPKKNKKRQIRCLKNKKCENERKRKHIHTSTQTNDNVYMIIIIKIITITISTTNIHIHHFKRHSTSQKHHKKTTTAQHTKQGNTKQKNDNNTTNKIQSLHSISTYELITSMTIQNLISSIHFKNKLHSLQPTFMCLISIAGVPFDSVRRFRVTLLLRTTCMCLCCVMESLTVWWHNSPRTKKNLADSG